MRPVLAGFFIVFSACAPGDDAPATPASVQNFVCPANAYLNCMPIVPPERQEFCSAEYRAWIDTNCPGVEIVY
jgi:hypothetical protein